MTDKTRLSRLAIKCTLASRLLYTLVSFFFFPLFSFLGFHSLSRSVSVSLCLCCILLILESMGCGISRPGVEQDATTHGASSNPIRRKIQEIRRAGTKRSTSTLSAKQLLDLEEEEDEDHVSKTSDKVEHLDKQEDVPKKSEDMAPPAVINEATVEAKHEEVVVDDYDHGDDDEDEDEDDEDDDKEDKEPRQREGDGDGDEDEDDDGSELAPGSPSFREYCVIPRDKSGAIENGKGKRNAEKRPEALQRKTSVESLMSEGSVTQELVKKRQKGRRSFRSVLPKGKNLLNVKACYAVIPCSTPNNAKLPPANTI